MAVKRTGVPTIIKYSRKISELVGKYGDELLSAYTSPQWAAAVVALRVAVLAFEALDDFPAETDDTGAQTEVTDSQPSAPWAPL